MQKQAIELETKLETNRFLKAQSQKHKSSATWWSLMMTHDKRNGLVCRQYSIVVYKFETKL